MPCRAFKKACLSLLRSAYIAENASMRRHAALRHVRSTAGFKIPFRGSPPQAAALPSPKKNALEGGDCYGCMTKGLNVGRDGEYCIQPCKIQHKFLKKIKKAYAS